MAGSGATSRGAARPPPPPPPPPRRTRLPLAVLLLAAAADHPRPACPQTIRTSLRPDNIPASGGLSGGLPGNNGKTKPVRSRSNGNPRAAGGEDGGRRLQGSLVPHGLPGTAEQRLRHARRLVSNLTAAELSGSWPALRLRLLDSCGLAHSLTRVGGGRTTHCCQDFNHVDCCAMQSSHHHNENEGRVAGMHQSNLLGPGIVAATVTEHGPGGSWCTCHIGAGKTPPRDVCHTQFESAVAFKLVWCPADDYATFVLTDDDGIPMARGRPTGAGLPAKQERAANYKVVKNSRYAQGCVSNSPDEQQQERRGI
eukprot:SAG22_NODE_587_length_8857_cov_5.973167_3_plen_311_part_00